MNEIEKVKRKLWTFGYSVKDVSASTALGFDLIVDGRHKVKVANKDTDLEAVPREIIVAQIMGDAIVYHKAFRGQQWTETSPLKAFPKVEEKED